MFLHNWFWQSIIATLLLVPVWLALGFYERNFRVSSEAFLVWYFLGVVGLSVVCMPTPTKTLFPSWALVLTILVIGATLGGVANVLSFRSVVSAPNPGLPLAIVNTVSVGVFFASWLLAKYWPQYFGSVKVDAWSLAGVLLTCAGVGLIALRR